MNKSADLEDRSIHTITLYLCGLGFGLILFRRSFGRLIGPRNVVEDPDTPLEDTPLSVWRRDSPTTKLNLGLHVLRKADYLVLTTALILSLRIEVFRQVSKAPECAVNGWTVFMPLLLAIYDWFRGHPLSGCQAEPSKSHLDETVYDALYRRYMNLKSRYVLPTLLVSFGSHFALGLWYTAPSTHICPLSGSQIHLVPFLQVLGLALDFCIALAAHDLINQSRPLENPRETAAVRLGTVFLVCSPFARKFTN